MGAEFLATGLFESCALAGSAMQQGASQIGFVEVCVRQVGISQVRVLEVGAFQVGTLEFRALEILALEFCLLQLCVGAAGFGSRLAAGSRCGSACTDGSNAGEGRSRNTNGKSSGH